MADPFHFRCTACGLCCTTPPSVALGEVAAQAQRFVLGFRLVPVPALDPVQHPQEMAALHRAAFGATDTGSALAAGRWRLDEARATGMKIGGTFLVVDPADVDAGTGCPQRAGDGLCAVHTERPGACRVVPFAFPQGPRANAAWGGARWKAMAAHQGWACDFGPDAPLLSDGRTVVDADAQDGWDRRRAPDPTMPGPASALAKATVQRAAALRQESLETLALHIVAAGAKGHTTWFPGALLGAAALDLGWATWARTLAQASLHAVDARLSSPRPTVFGGVETLDVIRRQWALLLERAEEAL